MKPPIEFQSLLAWRTAHGYSQYKAAEVLGLPRITYRRYEEGRAVKGKLLKRLREKTNVRLDVLAGAA